MDQDAIDTPFQARMRRVVTELEERGVKRAELARSIGLTKAVPTQWLSGEVKSLNAEAAFRLEEQYGYRARWVALGEFPIKRSAGSGEWPLSSDLLKRLRELDGEDLAFAENALRAHLRMPPLPAVANAVPA